MDNKRSREIGKRVAERMRTDPTFRRERMVDAIIAIQAREGIDTTRAQAGAAYDKIQQEHRSNDT